MTIEPKIYEAKTVRTEGRNSQFKITVRHFNNPLSIMNRPTRQRSAKKYKT